MKPKITISSKGPDGNIFAIMAYASVALKKADKAGGMEKAREMCDKVQSEASSYEDAIKIIQEYVEVIDLDNNI